MVRFPKRGEIWVADLNPTRGHEQAGEQSEPIDPPEGGIVARSYILCDALRSISRERLGSRPWGVVVPATMARVQDILRVLLDL